MSESGEASEDSDGGEIDEPEPFSDPHLFSAAASEQE